VGYVVFRFVPEARGSGIPHVKGVLLHVRAMPWKILVPVKFLGGLLGIGAGLSMGREGPTVQMGAAVGRMMADRLHVGSRTAPQLLSCGAGAGLAAAFNAPLAGFLFVIEELHRELSARTFAGALVAALAADIVTRAFSGDAPSFEISGYPALPLAALPVAALIGVAGGAFGWALNRSLLTSLTWPARLHALPLWMMPGLAAAICGLVAWWIPEAVGGGHATAEHLLRGQLGWSVGALAVLLLLKFALTVISYGSGAPGGIFAPMLLMGAILGAIGGRGFEAVLPEWGEHATAFQIVGMAALFSGSVRAPLTAIVLIVELTGNYQQLLALGVVCLVADLTAEALGSRPIYEALLEADLRRTPRKGEVEPEVSEPRSVYIGIQRGSPLEGKQIRQAGFPPGCLVVAIERGGREVLPEADLALVPGDHVTVLLPADEPEKAMVVVRLATGL
jgi:CIC family chloride channel protein